jgi:signal transduction histidine kinase
MFRRPITIAAHALKATVSLFVKEFVRVETKPEEECSDPSCVNGPGIPPTLRSKLFTAFASAEKQAGLGLGLAVSKEIVAVHGGEITATDSESGGTLMRVTLPRRTGVGAISAFQPEANSLSDRSA